MNRILVKKNILILWCIVGSFALVVPTYVLLALWKDEYIYSKLKTCVQYICIQEYFRYMNSATNNTMKMHIVLPSTATSTSWHEKNIYNSFFLPKHPESWSLFAHQKKKNDKSTFAAKKCNFWVWCLWVFPVYKNRLCMPKL